MSDSIFSYRLPNQSTNNKKRTRYVWWFNIGIESLWNDEKKSVLPQLINKGNLHTVNRTEQLCLLLASPEDIVIQREYPDQIILENLRNIGISTPEIWLPEHFENDEQHPISELMLRDKNILDKIRSLKSNQNTDEIILSPYAITHLDSEISLKTGCELIGSSNDTTAWINSKVNSRLLAEELKLPITEGYICDSIFDLEKAVEVLWRDNNNCKVAVKEAYGASGKGIFTIENKDSLQFLLNFIKRKAPNGIIENIVVEKWYDTAFDINYQIFIQENGNIEYIHPKKQIVREGVYVGSEFPINDSLTSEQNLFYYESALKIGNKLWQKGYRGLASIDSIITSDGIVFPIIEINGRFTLSTYISFIPALLGKDKIYFTKYYNLRAGIELKTIWGKISEDKYSLSKGEGILIYSFVEGIQNFSNGRLFALFVSRDKEKIALLEKNMDYAISKVEQQAAGK
jgi:predicted ATP-grasp superfamily ATP-dependent carboligase